MDICNNNNNNNNNKNEYNIKLYNSVFNNVYIKKIIFNHLTTYNILYNNIQFISHEQWEKFKYKDYLNNIAFGYEFKELNQLPENIKHINITPDNYKFAINNLNSIPNNIESIKLSTSLSSSKLNSIILTTNSTVLSKIISLDIDLKEGFDQQLIKDKLLESVTDLNMNCYQKNQVLEKDLMPISRNLKLIRLQNIKSIESECLLESLSEAYYEDCSTLLINQIYSRNLVKLHFISTRPSVISIIDSSIKFPETLEELSIVCTIFNAKLPNNLKSLRLVLVKLEDTIVFPSSLHNISILIQNLDNKEIFKNKESAPCNLKSLQIRCSSIVDYNGQSILPDKLERLIMSSSDGFNQVLQVNQLPSTLTYLDLGDAFNQVIDLNVLPSSLKRLILGKNYTQIINPLAIPQQLELLEILNRYYEHPINLPVSTHPNTLINCYTLGLYYNTTNTSIRKLRLSEEFNSPLSTLQLQDKSSLEYLNIGPYYFNQPIQLSDLPTNNNIKTLELSLYFDQTINLEYFQNLETIILKEYSNPKIVTTIINQQELIVNYYNLKNIIVPQNNNRFIIYLEKTFYKFIKINNIK